MKQRIFCLMLSLVMASAWLTGCGSSAGSEEAEADSPVTIGISLPNDTTTQWVVDGLLMSDALTAAGYAVDLRYAGDDAAAQAEQLQGMMDAGCETLIVAAVDPGSLTSLFNYDGGSAAAEDGESQSADGQETEANEFTYDGTPVEDGVNVIAYDTLITGCNAIDYYVGFDGYEAGYLQACYLERQLALYDAAGDGTAPAFTIELFFSGDNPQMAEFQYAGAMEVLQMYIDAGSVQVVSGQTGLEDCTVSSPEEAAQRMEEILASGYQETNLDAILCADDSLAQAVCDTLYSSYTGSIFPLITGKGCTDWSVNALLTGQQSMTLLLDCTGMAQEAASAAITLASGGTVDTQDSLDNGTINIPASLFYPQEVYSENYQQLLIDSGYFSVGDGGAITAQTDYFAGGDSGSVSVLSGYYTDDISAGESDADLSSEAGASASGSAGE